MSSTHQRSKKARASGELPPMTGMLDAYVDQKTPTSHDEGKPVSKKNKNQKKREQQREAEEKRRQSESNSHHQDEELDEVIDSWEEISAADAPQLPKTAIKVESPPKKAETSTAFAEHQVKKFDKGSKKNKNVEHNNKPERKEAEKSKPEVGQAKLETNLVDQMLQLSISKEQPESAETISVKQMLSTLQLTMSDVKKVFDSPPAAQKAAGTIDAKPDKKEKSPQQSEKPANVQAKKQQQQQQQKQQEAAEVMDEDEEKTREAIKAEREAKKLAKAAAKQASKTKTVDGEDDLKPAKVEKQSGEAEETGGKSKAELKAERRAKQEAQRAAKEQQKLQTAVVKPEANAKAATQPAPPVSSIKSASQPAPAKLATVKSQRVSDDIQADRPSVEKKRQRMLAAQQIPPRTKAQKQVLLFKHLHQYERELSVTRGYPIVGAHIHPSVMQLGLQYSEGTIQGSNARCVALLHTLKTVILEYETPEGKQFSRDLDTKLKLYISFLKECRPLSVSMGTAIRTLKSKVMSLDSGVSDDEAKELLCDTIDLFCRNVELAPESIAKTASGKIRDGDVILTYGCSSLLKTVLIKAATDLGCKFRVVVADGRPKLEGREMSRHLVNAGIHVTYIHVSAIPYIIKEVTKVLLGAHAVLANGFVMSRVGTSQVSLIASAHNVPVLVCCETYKFSERVQTDSFVFNELGDPDDLVATGTKSNPLEDWRDLRHLFLLNLIYDFTPANLVDAIISEISVIPCTSVPVVLRLKKDDMS